MQNLKDLTNEQIRTTIKKLLKEQQKELNKGLYFDREKLNATNKKIYSLRQERQERINIARRKEQEQALATFIDNRISSK